MKRFTILLTIGILFLLTGCNQNTQNYITVTGTVTNLEHEDFHFIYLPKYNSFTHNINIKQHPVPERNYVTITYNEISETFDDKTLYNQVEIGSTVEVTLHQVYDENNNLIEESIELIN